MKVGNVHVTFLPEDRVSLNVRADDPFSYRSRAYSVTARYERDGDGWRRLDFTMQRFEDTEGKGGDEAAVAWIEEELQRVLGYI